MSSPRSAKRKEKWPMEQKLHKNAESGNTELMGHNNPPSPIDEITSQYSDVIEECEVWLDGFEVENKTQMDAVDALSKSMKEAKKELTLAEKAEKDPLHKAWKDKIAEYKPTLDDFTRIISGLAAAQTPYKNKLAAEKEEAKRKAYEEARRKEEEAEKLAAQASETDIDAQREVAQANAAALDAKKAAAAANKDKVTGLRTYKTATVTDYAAFFKWMQHNDKALVLAWLDEQATKQMNAGHAKIDGVDITIKKKGY